MHVAVDLNWFLQFIGLAFAAAFGLLYLVRNTVSKYFMVDSNFDSSPADYSLDRSKQRNMAECLESCAVCGLLTTKHCAGCKMVKYCSGACQKSHWNSEHKTKCKELQSLYKANNTKPMSALRGKKASVPLGGSSKILKLPNEILFPYEEFVQLFNWDKQGYPPCGLLNCGNSCFANVVLQCLAYTRPLVAYLLEKGHRIECRRNDWCFFCEFQFHVESACRSLHPFSPINILSRLPNIGGNLDYGKQEDAHEFMRFAIDNMQSACLDEFGGEKAVHPSCQETTLIQHIFGGRLQSQVICTQCNNVSNQFENMMDLTVEIHGDAGSLEECLDQFTVKEQLHGDNLYKCDGCNDYVMAWKRLSIRRAPNILTIALKRFQSGRFGKLNKRVTFPETLDLSAYMSELEEDGNDIYKLYAVIVHVDMLNASFFGHYICYIKDFHGNWYMIDDCKVASVDLDEVLSQGAYMLMYSRVCARPSCLLPSESIRKEENENLKLKIQVNPSLEEPAECSSTAGCADSFVDPGLSSSTTELTVKCEEELSPIAYAEDKKGGIKIKLNMPIDKDVHNPNGLSIAPKEVRTNNNNQPNHSNTPLIDEIKIQPDVKNGEFSLPIDFVKDSSWESETDANEGLIEKMEKESNATETCIFKENYNTSDVSASVITSIEELDEMDCDNSISISENAICENGSACNSCDVSASVITSIDELDEMDCDNSISTSENANCKNGSASPRYFQDAAKKSDGESSAGKLKPIFSPGFLGKRSGNKLSKSRNGVFLESSANCENGSASPHYFQDAAKKSDGESSAGKLKPVFSPGFLGKRSGKKLNKQGNGVFLESSEVTPKRNGVRKTCLLCENGGFLKEEEKPYDVHENGNGSVESYMCKSITNGDFCDQSAFHEGTNNLKNERLKVGEPSG